MRFEWLWLFSVVAIVGSLVTPWGVKHVYDEHCESTWDQQALESSARCHADEWRVAYRPLSMETTHTYYTDPDHPGEPKDWAYAYGDPEAPHHEGVGPLLEHGGPFVFVGAGVLALTGVAYQLARKTWLLQAARAGWALHLVSVASFLAGVAYHSGTWRAEDVDDLAPGLGLLFAVVPLLAGVPLLPQQDEGGMPTLPVLE